MSSKNIPKNAPGPPPPKNNPIGTPGVMNMLHQIIQAPNNRESSVGDKLFRSTFGTILFARRWYKLLTSEKKARIMKLFTNPRDDINDVYKPNSYKQTQTTIETPLRKPLSPETGELIHQVALNFDYCVPLDVIEGYTPQSFISTESLEQINRLPSWLRFLVLFKFDSIHAFYGHHTHHFLKHLANQVDIKRVNSIDVLVPQNEDDLVDTFEINNRFTLSDEELERLDHKRKRQEILNSDLFRLRMAIWRWRLPRTLELDWSPEQVHSAAVHLRRALLTAPTLAEAAIVAEDELLKLSDANLNQFDDEEEEGEKNEMMKRPSWEDLISNSAGFKEEVNRLVEEDLMAVPSGMTKSELKEEKRLMQAVNSKKKDHKRSQGCGCCDRIRRFEVSRFRRDKHERNLSLTDRALYRRYSRIWYKGCGKEPIKQAKRLPHHFRYDEGFHAYCVAVVGSKAFKAIIMVVIILNALTLALDTEDIRTAVNVPYFFEVIDDVFLSIYFIEFLLKIYAHPNRYWASGFNRFDFGILIVSFVKQVLDWLSIANKYPTLNQPLQVLAITRALRILRGVSLSVQIQVLIAALVKTLKTHVLSVLVLMFLLMYITAVMANLFFRDLVFPGHENPWSELLSAMIRLFSFVTMDGWTVTVEEFEAADDKDTGRLFCLIGILIGNFLISNIFIAIIIMQISEATEEFRARQREEREEITRKKKEIVFRRQKLDMRQLLAKQTTSQNADFYYLGSQFLHLLRHDDLVDMNDVPFSPLWMDAIFKATRRCHHTANLLMNLHRQIADNLLEVYTHNNLSKYNIAPIRRARYNRCMKMKAKLALIRQEFFNHDPTPVKVNKPLRFRFAADDKAAIGKAAGLKPPDQKQ